MSPFRGFDDVMSMFDSLDDQVIEKGRYGGQGVSQMYVSSSRMGPDGKLYTENYFNNNIQGITEDGHKIGQIEEMYGNSQTGLKKIAQTKTLDDHAAKIVQTKRGQGNLS